MTDFRLVSMYTYFHSELKPTPTAYTVDSRQIVQQTNIKISPFMSLYKNWQR